MSPVKREYVLVRVPSSKSTISESEDSQNAAPKKVKTPRVRKVTAIAQLPLVKSRGPLDAQASYTAVGPRVARLLEEPRYQQLRQRVLQSGSSGEYSVEGAAVSLVVQHDELYIRRGSKLQPFRVWLDRRFFVMPQQQKQRTAGQVKTDAFDETEHLRSLLTKNTIFL